MALVAGACGAGTGDGNVATVPPTAATGATTTAAPPVTAAPTLPTVPGILAGFEQRTITVDGQPWLVAVAATPAERARGLMNVTALGALDGMLFVFDADTEAGFWMQDTLIPLEIAFFDSAGSLVAVLEMEPCTADPCPTYRPGASYRFALEAPPGPLGRLPARAELDPMS